MDSENSRLEKLKKSLYSRNEHMVPRDIRSTISERDIDVPTNWDTPKSFSYEPSEMTKKTSNSFFNKFLLWSLGFFVLCLSVAAFIFFGGINSISSDNLDIKITAPSSVSSGEELPVGLSIVNGNRVDLDDVVLFVNYPEGSQSINSDNALTHETVSLGRIPKGGSIEHSLRNMIFGEKDSVKTFTFRIEYKVKGSNATFSKEKTLDVSIGSSPLLFEISYPKEINSGQEVKLKINITSNSSVVLKNSLIKIEYPYGFTYKTSSLKPLRDNSIWNIGDLKDGDKKTLEVTGVMIGQNEEDKTFRILAGVQSADNTKDFNTSLVEEDLTIGIRKSFFDLQVITTEDGIREIGQVASVVIKWQNTLPDKIINAKIQTKLSGNIFDRTKVSIGNGGFFQSVDNTVLWDKNNNNNLSQLMPGDGSQVSVSIVSLTDPLTVRKIKNPYMNVKVIMTGNRDGDDNELVSSEADITIKILSTLSLSSKTYRSFGSIVNSGPIPPKADTETTYTINWSLTNTTNDLGGVSVKTKLPIGVSWKGDFSPLSEKINYDPDTRTVTWNVGSISAGSGFTYSPKEVSFKVGIVPSLNQVTATPPLTGDVNVVATDTYTNSTINVSSRPSSTEYSDPSYKNGDGIVTK